jgi:hypothetical protein
MGEINDATFGARSNVLKNELGQGITSMHDKDINKVQKLNQQDQLANTEFGDMVGDIKRTNTVGLEKWKNDQAGNEQLYKAYQNEKAYQQPRLLGNAKVAGAMSGIDGMFGHFANQGVDLNSISDLQNKYSNLEKELSTANNKIKTYDDYAKQKQQIALQEKAKQDQQRLLDAQNAKKIQDAKNQAVQNAKTQAPQYDYNALRNELMNIGVIDLKPSQAYYPQQQARLNELQNLLKGRAIYGTRYQNPDPFYSNMVYISNIFINNKMVQAWLWGLLLKIEETAEKFVSIVIKIK